MPDDTTNQDQFLVNNPDDTNPQSMMADNQQLPQDNAPPAAPPADVSGVIGDTAPPTDTGIDQHEQYDAGIQDAANVTPPPESAVTGFTPPAASTPQAPVDEETDMPQAA